MPEMYEGDPCSYCGGPGGQADHIVALSRGGKDDWTNVTASCSECNQQKRSKDLLSYLMQRQIEAIFPGWVSYGWRTRNVAHTG